MNTPAISELLPAAPGFPILDARRAPAPQRRFLDRTGFAAAPRRHADPTPSVRPAAPGRSPVREILAGVLLLVAWTLLWSFFLAGVVEPGAALHREARAAEAAARWIDR